MTTLKGVIRSYGAAVKRVERDQQRKAREAANKFKEQQKNTQLVNAKEEVQNWNSYTSMLRSVHKNCTDSINWSKIKAIPKDEKPKEVFYHTDIAEKKLAAFRPSVFDKIFKTGQSKILKFKTEIVGAKEKDEREYAVTITKYNEALEEWKELHDIALGIEGRNPEFYKRALQYFDPFDDISELGTRVNFSFQENHIDIDLHINGDDIIPNYELTLTTSGKVSKKNMTKIKFNELYQDYVCSVVLRVAREVFSYLPIDYARINAMSKLLNTSSGFLEEKAILSVIIPPQTMNSINLLTVDPSDCMRNFLHNMNFKKTSGFTDVEKVNFIK